MAQSHSSTLVYIAAALAAIGGFLFGYDTGVISGALLSLRQEFNLSILQQEGLVAALLAAATVIVPFAGSIADAFGRRRTILYAALLFIVGGLIMAFSPNYGTLIIARILLGAAIGVASLTVPLYISEISPPATRGLTVSLNQMMITIGILVSYSVDLAFASTQGAWRWMTGMSVIPAAILWMAMIWLPETPRWLVKKNREKEARNVFRKLGIPAADIDGTIEILHNHLARFKTGWSALFNRHMLRPLITGMLLAIFQQITGINAVIYYAPDIFQLAGYRSDTIALLATVGVGIVNVIMTAVSLWLLDRVGRRPLLFWGLSAMVVGTALLGSFWIFSIGASWIPIFCLMLFIAGFAVGLGTVAWLFVAEIYPLHVRGLAMSLGVTVSWAANFLVSFTFLTMAHAVGPGGTFWIYGALSVGCIFFVWAFIPETKGRTLEQIETFWGDKLPKGITTRVD